MIQPRAVVRKNILRLLASLFVISLGSFLNNDRFMLGDNEIPKLSIIGTLIGGNHDCCRVTYVPEAKRVPASGSMSISNSSNSVATKSEFLYRSTELAL